MGDLSSEEVTLRIKSASNRCEDLEFSFKLKSNIKELKNIIRQKHPLKPETRDQRLIYSGHLLEDSKVLRDILLQNNQNHDSEQTSYTIHLVCSSKLAYRATVKENKGSSSNNVRNAESNVSNNPRIQTPNAQSVPFPNNYSQFNAPQPGLPQDIYGYHQQYLTQMMTFMNQWAHYNQYMTNPYAYSYPPPSHSASTPYPLPTPQGMNYIPPNLNAQNFYNYGQPQQQVPPPHPQQQHQQPEEQINEPAAPPQAAAARVDDAPPPPAVAREDDEQQRDLLEWIYTIIRMMIIFSIVYYYANFIRFFLVVTCAGLVMVLQRRGQINQDLNPVLPANNQQEQRQQEPQPPPAPPNDVPNIERNESDNNVNNADDLNNREESNVPQQHQQDNVEVPGGGGVREDEGQGETPNIVDELPQPLRNYYRDIAWTFVTTFFTSLIPETQHN